MASCNTCRGGGGGGGEEGKIDGSPVSAAGESSDI